jgi:hypothetical protein
LRQPRATGKVSASVEARLSSSTRRILDRHIERAMKQRFGSASNLRQVVRIAATELASAGASKDVIRTVLTRSVEDHPQRYTWDRVSILTGLQASDVLTAQVIGWVGERGGVDDDGDADQPRARRRRVSTSPAGTRRSPC